MTKDLYPQIWPRRAPKSSLWGSLFTPTTPQPRIFNNICRSLRLLAQSPQDLQAAPLVVQQHMHQSTTYMHPTTSYICVTGCSNIGASCDTAGHTVIRTTCIILLRMYTMRGISRQRVGGGWNQVPFPVALRNTHMELISAAAAAPASNPSTQQRTAGRVG